MPAPAWPDERLETKCAVIDRDLTFDVASSPDTSLDCQGADYRTAGAFILKIVCDKNLRPGNAGPSLFSSFCPVMAVQQLRPSSRHHGLRENRTRFFKASTRRCPGQKSRTASLIPFDHACCPCMRFPAMAQLR